MDNEEKSWPQEVYDADPDGHMIWEIQMWGRKAVEKRMRDAVLLEVWDSLRAICGRHLSSDGAVEEFEALFREGGHFHVDGRSLR